MTGRAVRAALYVRVSSEEQATGGTSLETQEQRCRAYCVAQGWTVQDLYMDAGVSGAKASRPALDAMLGAVHAGQVDAVLVAKLDRLGRTAGHLAPLLQELDDRGVAFVSLAEQWDTSTAQGRFVRGMFAQLAELERGVILERTASGRRARIAQGGWGGGNIAPYGYRIVGKRAEAHLELDEREAAMIRRAVELLLDRGMTTGQAARALNAEGYTPRQAPRWSQTNLRNVLLRKRFDGTWTYGKEARGGGQAEPLTVAVPPVLDAERAEALRTYLRATATDKPPRERPYPLTGRLVGTCGHTFHGVGRADRTVIRYRCTYARDTPHHERCLEPTVRAEEVEGAVWASVLELLADPRRLLAQAAEHLGLLEGAAGVERDALARAQVQVERRQQALVDATATSLQAGVDADTLRHVIIRLQRDLAEARHHVRMVAAMQAETGVQVERVSQVQQLALVAQDRLVTADRALQQRVLALLDVRVTVLDHGQPGNRARRGGPVRLRVEGSVAHDLLLAGAESDWHPCVLATAPG